MENGWQSPRKAITTLLKKGAQYLNVNFEGKEYNVDQFYDVF